MKIVITGASRGLGKAIAETFADDKQGHTLLLSARNKEALQLTGKELQGRFPRTTVLTHACDLADKSAVDELAAWILEKAISVDILVNNAGINMKKIFTEVSDEDFQKVITTNLCSVFSMSREVVKHMLPRKSGCIINISSMAAQYGLPKVIAYSASKTAIDGMTRAMAVELSPEGIRVNAIAPGWILTERQRALWLTPEAQARLMEAQCLKRELNGEDVARVVLFLCSDEAGAITSQQLLVDGGRL